MKTRTPKFGRSLIAFLTIFVSQAAFAFYNPEVGQWANRDLIQEEGGLNLYSYVHNNPINSVDPFGLQLTGSGTLALEPTLLMSEEAIAALNAARAAKLAEDARKAAAAAAIAAAWARCEARKRARAEPLPRPRTKECDKEWSEPRAKCAQELAKPNPSPGLTGGYDNIEDCARGLVSEACGGNPVAHPKPKPAKEWKF